MPEHALRMQQLRPEKASSSGALQWNRPISCAAFDCLAGLCLDGKGFAYLGFPPLLCWRDRPSHRHHHHVFGSAQLAGLLTTLPAVLLVALMALVVARTLPFIGLYGFESAA